MPDPGRTFVAMFRDGPLRGEMREMEEPAPPDFLTPIFTELNPARIAADSYDPANEFIGGHTGVYRYESRDRMGVIVYYRWAGIRCPHE